MRFSSVLWRRSRQSIVNRYGTSILITKHSTGISVTYTALKSDWSRCFRAVFVFDLRLEDVNSVEYCSKVANKWSYFDIKYVGDVELGLQQLSQIARLPPPATQGRSGASGQGGDRNDRGRQLAMFGGINVDKYPRPEISRWTIIKPEPGKAKVMAPVVIESGVSESAVEDAPISGPTINVPEPVALFMSKLPTRQEYHGTLKFNFRSNAECD